MSLEPLTADRRRQQTRDYLLEAAAQVFAARGFHDASIDEIAAAAGFTKGAVYSNFKNKEDLFLALIEANYAREMAALKETLEASDIPPEARLGDFVGLIRNEIGAMPDNWGTLFFEFGLYAMRHPAARERLNQLVRTDVEAIAEIIAQVRQEAVPESVESAARIIVALFQGVAWMRVLDPDTVGDALVEDAIAFATRAMGYDV
jgi:AcrR family transcriptional regulator